MCIFDSPPSYCTESCGHLTYPKSLDQILSSLQPLPPLPSIPLHDIASLSSFQGYVNSHSDLLSEINAQVRDIRSNLYSLSSEISTVQVEELNEERQEVKEETKRNLYDGRTLLREICPRTGFMYALRLFSDFRSPVYKNKPFSLELKVIDADRQPLHITDPLIFQVKVFKATLPLEEINTEESGQYYADPGFLSGEAIQTVQSSAEIVFSELSFSNVTSSYPENWVFLVVHCSNNDSIKPLVLEGVRVKARKPIVAET